MVAERDGLSRSKRVGEAKLKVCPLLRADCPGTAPARRGEFVVNTGLSLD
jgi:hypothetical protein